MFLFDPVIDFNNYSIDYYFTNLIVTKQEVIILMRIHSGNFFVLRRRHTPCCD